jgi:hypothetical protein
MRRHWRWAVAAAGVALLLALPFAARLAPAGRSSVAAGTLLSRIEASDTVAYSGYAQSTGGLSIPVTTSGFDVGNLLGGTTQLRVWWRADTAWRVDSIAVTGETDLYRDRQGTWTWQYESSTAERSTDPSSAVVRLPRADDLVPATLARRLLSEAAPGQVRRLPNARIAGEQAAGLRLQVDDPKSTIDHVDVWALPSDGLPLRVSVYGRDGTPVVSSTMLDLSLGRPAAPTVSFTPAAGEKVRESGAPDLVSAIDQFGRSSPPESIGGLTRRPDLDLGAVGVYGRGVTVLVALPLSGSLARTVVKQLTGAAGASAGAAGVGVSAGPVNLQLSPAGPFGSRWLLVGTVTPATLLAAVPDLPPARGFGFRR